jgi:hypothetical protein
MSAAKGWRLHAIAAIAEGFCPNHGGVQLTSSARYCFACECRYSIEDGTTVIATYGCPRWP